MADGRSHFLFVRLDRKQGTERASTQTQTNDRFHHDHASNNDESPLETASSSQRNDVHFLPQPQQLK
jgi:hypothetical protein